MDAPRLDRRTFLARSGTMAAGAGALALGACSPGSQEAHEGATETSADLRTWSGVRAQFDLDPRFSHLAAFILASHPSPVRSAIARWREALDQDPASVVADETAQDEEVRAAAARFLSVSPDEIALTDSTTMGLALTYNGLRLKPGDHVLTTTHDFYSSHESLRLATERSGAELEQVALYNDPSSATAETMVELLLQAVRRSTKVVAITWVHSSTGVKIPVRAISEALAEINQSRTPEDRVLLCLDAIHGFGAEDVTPAGLGCDVFITGTHKWLFGPRGTGLVWAHRDVWPRLSPIIPTFSGPSIGGWLTGERAPFIFGLDGTPGGFQAFEHRWAVPEAFKFHLDVGRTRIEERIRELANHLKAGLSALPRVRLITPEDPELSSGIVCFELRGIEPGQVVETLRREHRIGGSVTPYFKQYVRFGPTIVNTPEQVDAAIEAIAALR